MAEDVKPQLLRDSGVYGGASGIWANKKLTAKLTEDEHGITVSVLHNGFSYADDLAEDCVLYHYPETNRPPSRDGGEIAATKNAKSYKVPLFVITHPQVGADTRNVHIGWVEDWDDRSKEFLITFGEAPARESIPSDQSSFSLTAPRHTKQREVAARIGQQRFKFQVFQRYGPCCAVCGISEHQLLDAAHLRPKSKNGSDDPRNGLVLCSLHHRALDAGLYAIQPDTLVITTLPSGPSCRDLRIEREDLSHLPLQPHHDAVSWLWQEWERKK